MGLHHRVQPHHCLHPLVTRKTTMSHANAALTPRHRLKVAQLVVDHGWPISEVAARFQVSWPTVKRWADRYRAGQSMQDRSSRPHCSPNKTSPTTAKRCIQLRLRLREGPVQLAYRIGVAPSTVHRIGQAPGSGVAIFRGGQAVSAVRGSGVTSLPVVSTAVSRQRVRTSRPR